MYKVLLIEKFLKFILPILIIQLSLQGFAQLSKTHYIPPLTSAAFGNANPEDQYIYISTPNNSNVPYTIIPLGQPASNYITGTVSNALPQQITVGTGYGQLFIPSTVSSVVTNNRGYIIEAEAPIYVSIRMNAGEGAQAGALVSKGLSALGTTFRVGSFTNANPSDNYLNFVSVMATEDNTSVNFSNLPSGLQITNYSGATPINITLNEGESYTLATHSDDTVINQDGLIGCLVNSDKPIVVNCGSANGSFGTGNGRDYGIDQIVDVSKVGTEYIFVRGDGDNAWENVLIVAHSNNTTVSINGNAPITSINAGDYYVIEGNQYNSNGNMYVETSQPAFAYQGVGGLGNNGSANEANQGLFFVPPLSCETRGNLDNIANINNIGNTNYSGGISIVTKVGATVNINGAPISAASNPVNGKPDYITYKVKGLSGNIAVQSDDELYCAYFNYNGSATSGSFYSGFPSAPEINFDAQFATLGNCIPNITLEAANTQSFDSFKWLFDDGSGSGFIDLLVTTTSITPTLPGKYKLVGIITCTGEELESIEIPISVCPDDRDNDGIIDNIDIDNDNDGILNCTESRGDVILDLSNTSSPILRFEDGTSNTTIATNTTVLNRTTTGTNTINLMSTGHITSTIPQDNNAENEYNITFTEPVNVKFYEDITATLTNVDGAFYIVKVLPVNKNITLINPSDRLLVDSNFDGIFETGVTSISGSEIHFKPNPNAIGTIPYEFLANQVDQFSFIHKLENITTASTFSANIGLKCFKNDHDLDGIKDEFDLDSDNDGIPDSIEYRGSQIALSGIDNDKNGLDDVFFSIFPLDYDGDGVYDFYDLDSDNDGIYDVLESGSGLLDSNMDGIIDNINSTIGLNGWDDNAETSADSNQIGYLLDNLDADNIFSYIDEDTDGDGCSDVFEAGFSDGNNDFYLGDTPPVVDDYGVVINASDGYTLPNSDYSTATRISITKQPEYTTACESSLAIFSLVTDAGTMQWETSPDKITWTPLTDTGNFSGTQSSDLNIANVPTSLNNNWFRARLNSTGTRCITFTDEVLLLVNAQPKINPTVILVQCDDDNLSTLGFSPFNLTEANTAISTNASNETFSYYLTQSSALLGDITSTDYISNPTSFVNRTVSNDLVWARVESQGGCAAVAQIEINVSTTVVPSTYILNFNQCDDNLDIDGNDTTNNDNRDGIANFDFSSVTASFISFTPPGQSTLPPRYYRNEVDALAEVNEITDPSNYRNIGYPNSQYIYVRVDSALSNDCLALGAHILLTVEPLPELNTLTIARQCDDDGDGKYPFDTTQIENDILGNLNPANFTFSYFDENGTALSSPLPNPFLTASQTITVQVSNKATSAPDGPCFDETILTFTVDAQPIVNTIPDLIVCDGSARDNDSDGFYPFDTSAFNASILGSQTGMEIYYTYTNENGNLLSNQSNLPNPLNSKTQTIIAEVINPENNTCTATTTINFIVNSLPKFTVDTPRLVCSSDPSFAIDLQPFEANITESFNYEWVFSSLDGTITNQFVSNNKIISVSEAGIYNITLTKTDGTNCTKTLSIFVDASQQAVITQDAVTIKDLSDNNTVIIDTTNLGNGNYQYALQEENSPFINYQTKATFNNVKPGFYTIHIKDDICGVSTLDISVIGYPKYFTPNGDGVNDFWRIKGVNNVVQPNTTVYIYDRYGKLIKQLLVSNSGWDGTSKGNILPNNDYWFQVKLDDGRTFSGHFALKR
ncbi:T9SS type B sorting domain-containing protein [Algibacter amylolyticus]|uniref:T9SS type B sorting domain-containing protein n=1 Tax=Algibacter amylolyticus TaxID=1608400 RepID=A0A5M7BAH0_9FLAO|nr:T9SS type B sorting domain-containing protein [Algibacter amylolyticus]KAA5824431.1 T9SS type B sorting domain-containing protein [Algibacter amylolyticus]MBB5269511.1 gliding motility-associated-like protein [Algibacter amylolyticus]TSJ75204.1 T9SS type B sorting domain-containing protein [Algibacter amylolyticus]